MRIRTGILVLTLMSIAGCSRIFAPGGFDQDDRWERTVTNRLILYYRPVSLAEAEIDTIACKVEAAYDDILGELDLNYDGVVSIFLYDSQADAGWDRLRAKAYPRTETIETIYGSEVRLIAANELTHHEIAHIITWNALGEPGTRFMSEGVAVAMDGYWGSPNRTTVHVHQWVSRYQGEIPSIDKIIKEWDWDDRRDTIYPLGGSFVLYLLENYGADKFKKLFVRALDYNFSNEFQRIYEESLNNVQSSWRVFCSQNYK